MDDRQYVRWDGQDWLTLDELRKTHKVHVADEAGNITGFGVTPAFAIDQRAMLLQSPAGNVLWDCVSLIDDAAIAEVKQRGGLAAIAISHPHFYTSMVEWSDAFGGVPIYIHEDERQWVQRPSPAIRFWSGETQAVNAEMTLVRCGGHFSGGQVLHWGAALGGRGALFTGDIVMVVMDRRYVSFMRSFPNIVPLNRARRRAHRRRAGPAGIRRDFRRLVAARGRDGRQGGRRPLGRALSPGDFRLRTVIVRPSEVPILSPGKTR